MPEAVQIFIAPPDPAVLRERLVGRATDSPEEIEKRLRRAEVELEAQDDFPHVVVNDDVQGRRGAGAARPLRAARTGTAD